ncbi:hypothetical protein CRENBAI_001434 [Crenichthys baileyi]|uniref:Uncharacterized protein n=1 Tax=Crenichthys baileyi TaxID=28760 RepID=A0AAV9S2D1_9TELE
MCQCVPTLETFSPDNQRFQSLMKASHLKDRSDGARSECFQRHPNDFWEQKNQQSLPPHNLPLIFFCSLRALGYSVTEGEEEALFFLMFSSCILSRQGL